MVTHRGFRFRLISLATLAAIALHIWLLQMHSLPGEWLSISFALLCLTASWSLDLAFKRTEVPAVAAQVTRAEPRASAPSTPAPVQRSRVVNAFTIDLEDYFQTEVASRSLPYSEWDRMPSRIEHSVQRMLDLLDESDARATVFVLGWIAERYPRLVREVARRGHEIGCHSYRHRRVYTLSPEVFAEDTRLAKRVLEDVIGSAVEGYRAPSFSITPGTEWAFHILEDLGFLYDSSVNPVWHSSYANQHAPRFPYYPAGTRLLEIPIGTWRIGNVNLPVGGGAYLRLLPYGYIRRGLSVINTRERQPATLYVHPWEIDYHQPALHKKWSSQVRQMWGTRTMEAKLRKLLASSRFEPISIAYSQALTADWPLMLPQREVAPLAQVC
jgi:polysaccharide deacetylase family protein (PEP-CTERM system associated)